LYLYNLIYFYNKTHLMKKLQVATRVLGLILLLSGCCGARTEKGLYSITQNTPFTIEDIYSQNWVAGVKGGGSGTSIYITIKNIEPGTIINEIYFRNKIVKVEKSTQNVFIGYFNTKNNRDVIMDSNAVKEAENSPPKRFPFKLAENEAVLSYIFKGKEYFCKVSKIAKKKIQAFPQSNLNIEN